MLSREQVKQSILDCADKYGEIRFLSSPPSEALEMVREGRLVRIDYFTFSLPEGG